MLGYHRHFKLFEKINNKYGKNMTRLTRWTLKQSHRQTDRLNSFQELPFGLTVPQISFYTRI